jgi:hypothetical protein
MTFTKSLYVVLDENTLGYIFKGRDSIMGVLQGSVMKGSTHDWLDGEVALLPGVSNIRPATESDFNEYRVNLPPGFEEGKYT